MSGFRNENLPSDMGLKAGSVYAPTIVVLAMFAVAGFMYVAIRANLEDSARYVRTVHALEAEVQAARRQAITQRRDVRVDFDSTSKEFIREVDLNQDGVISSDERTVLKMAEMEDINVSLPFAPGSFTPQGTFHSLDRNWKIRIWSSAARSTYIRVISTGYTVIEDVLSKS